MDYSPIIQQVFKLWWLIPLFLLIALFKSPWFKGMVGEALVRLVARLRLPAETYRPIHNVTLPTLDGTPQIDHVFVSRFGIFVVETKNMKGWIYGGEHQPQWTQKIFRTSFKFQNPLRQNYKHIKALEAALEVPSEVIRSVIVFAGDSTFKTPMPPNVTHGGGYIGYIRSFREPVLTDAQVERAVALIQSGRLAPSRQTHREHVRQLKSRNDVTAQRRCPKCGSPMVLRTVARGAAAGKRFWGCSTFPRCRTVQPLS